MRILHVADFYPPHIGGLERHVQGLARQLVSEGHDVCVVVPGNSLSRRADDGVTVWTIRGLSRVLPFVYRDSSRRYPLPMRDPLLLHDLQAAAARFRPDIVHAHGWVAFTALNLDHPTIVTLHDYGLVCPKRSLLAPAGLCQRGPGLRCLPCSRGQYGAIKGALATAAVVLSRPGLARARRYIAVSTFVRQAYLRYAGLSPQDVTVIPNFHWEDEPSALPSRLPLPEDFILYAGALTSHKGIDVLLAAHRRLQIDVPLVLIGHGSGAPLSAGPNVHIITNAPHGLVMEAWARCRLGVVPSLWPEPLPTTALEAMSRGKALVASDIGGLPDVVRDGETGFLVPSGDVPALAGALTKLLLDDCLCRRLGERAREVLHAYFTGEVVVPRIEALYREIVG